MILIFTAPVHVGIISLFAIEETKFQGYYFFARNRGLIKTDSDFEP